VVSCERGSHTAYVMQLVGFLGRKEQGIPVAKPIAELLDKDGPIPPDVRTESFSYRCLIAAGIETNLLSVPPNIISHA
jgi:hypothetical protein